MSSLHYSGFILDMSMGYTESRACWFEFPDRVGLEVIFCLKPIYFSSSDNEYRASMQKYKGSSMQKCPIVALSRPNKTRMAGHTNQRYRPISSILLVHPDSTR